MRTNQHDNPTWFEIRGQQWHFTGADEYDSKGLNQPVTVRINKQAVKSRTTKRSPEIIRRALEKHLDPAACPTAELLLE